MKYRRALIFWSLLLALPSSFNAQEKSPEQTSNSAKDFVQEFYTWYVPIASEEHVSPASDLALRHKGSEFSPELLRALREDSEAQAKSPGEIVGLDFDPFLASQDPAERYEVGRVTQKGDRYCVEVYAILSGKKTDQPSVVPELIHENGRWLFANFHYPDARGDLLAILNRLREERQKSAR